MSIPTYEEVMLSLIEVIYDGSIYTNKECEKKSSKIFKLTDDELNESV